MGGTFSIGGLASGLDTKSLIEQLMNIEQQPLNKIETQKAAAVKKNTDFQAVNTVLMGLKGAAFDLTLDLNMRAKAATSSDTAILTAKASPTAATGSYQVRVDRLATASSTSSTQGIGLAATGSTLASALSITAGNFTLQYTDTSSGTAQTRQLTIAVDTADSLDVIADRITNQSGGAITASFASNKLTLTASATTADLVAGSDADTSNLATQLKLRTATYSLGSGVVGGTLASSAGVATANVSDALDSATGTLAAIGFTSTTAGTFKINGTSVSYDTTTDSINTIISAINSSSAGVIAAYNSQSDKLVITSRNPGSGAVTMEDTSGTFLQTMGLTGNVLGGQTVVNGQNAKLTLKNSDGTSVSVESTTNSVTSLIPNVTFTAVKVDADYQTVTIKADSSAVLTKVKSLVDNYNKVYDKITDLTAKGASNAFDSDLRTMLDRVKSMMSSQLTSLTGTPRSMIDLGIHASTEDRVHLSVDEDVFTAALEDNPDRVADIFKKSTTSGGTTTYTGIAGRISEYLTSMGSDSGVFKTRDRSTTTSSRRYDEQITKYQKRMEQVRATLVAQFSAMEQAVSRLKSQQSAFTSQLSSL